MKSAEFHTLLELTESKFGRGPSKNWINRDFEDLSFEISKKTKTHISPHTLKRIFGKLKTDEYYLPQKATFTALKQYCNFDKADNSQTSKVEHPVINKQVDVSPIIKKSTVKIKYTVVISVLIVAISCVIIFFSVDSNGSFSGTVKLLSTEGQVPLSAQFEYSTPNDKDSFRICYDSNFEPVDVPTGKNRKSNYFYQYPGLFSVRMWDKTKIISETVPVYVQSTGWMAFGSYTYKKQFERFYHLNIKKCIHNSVFSPAKGILYAAGIDTTRLAEVSLHNYHPTGVVGDNFTLETTLNNADEWPGATCNSVYLHVAGSKESIQFHFANPGCSYWIHCRISEKKLDKRNENLKDFTFDMKKWQQLRIENKDKNIHIFVNDTLRYTTKYAESIGEIMGVTIRFQGNGYLKNYSLSDSKGNDIFKFQPDSIR